MTYAEFKQNFLREFLNIKSFAGKMKYASEHLTRIGSGTGRVVFDIDGEKVLKLAKNPKGIAQNEAEAGAGRYPDTHGIVTEVFEEADNDEWLISEKAKKVNEKRIKDITGIPSLNDLYVYLRNFHDANNGRNTIFGLDNGVQEFLNENEFTQELQNFIANYSQSPGDMGRPSTYGEVLRDGQPTIVLTDYGLNDEVYDTHYNPQRKQRYRMYELYNFADGNDDILNDMPPQDGVDTRHGMWGLMPYGVMDGDGDGVINEGFISFVMNRDKYPTKPLPSTPYILDEFHNIVNNLQEVLNKVSDKKKFYNNLLELQDYLIRGKFYDRDPLGKQVVNLDEVRNNPLVPTDKLETEQSDKLASKLARKLNLGIPQPINEGGANGRAYMINGNRVLKITVDACEVDAAVKTKSTKPRTLVNAQAVYKIQDREKNIEVYAIIMDFVPEKPEDEFTRLTDLMEVIQPNLYIDLLGTIMKQKGRGVFVGRTFEEFPELAQTILTANSTANIKQIDRQKAYQFMLGLYEIKKDLVQLKITSNDFMTLSNLGYKDGVLVYFDIGGCGAEEPNIPNNAIIALDEDGSALYSTENSFGQDNFPAHNNMDTSPSIQNDLNANSSLYEDLEYNHVVGDATEDEFQLSERDMSYMPKSSTVDVKKKCRLGGNGNTSTACNQGDISNLNIKPLREEVSREKYYRAVEKNLGKTVEFEPEGFYEAIDDDGNPIFKYDTFWVSDKPEVAASKSIGGAVMGLYSMFMQYNKSPQVFYIYEINEKPDVDISHWEIGDFTHLKEVRYRKAVQGHYVGKVTITDDMKKRLNAFYEVNGLEAYDEPDEETSAIFQDTDYDQYLDNMTNAISESIHKHIVRNPEDSLKAILSGKKDIDFIDVNKKFSDIIEKNKIGIIPVRMTSQNSIMSIVYTNKEKAFKLYEFLKTHDLRLTDKTAEEAREIGRLMGYNENRIEEYIRDKYGDVNEGVGDKYFEKLIGRNPDADIENKLNTQANIENKEKIIYDNYGNRIIINPKTLENVSMEARGIIDEDGNLYVNADNEIIHSGMVDALAKRGIIQYDDYWHLKLPNDFITIQRLEDTDIFYLGESNSPMNVVSDRVENYWTQFHVPSRETAIPAFQRFLNKAKQVNPQYEFENELIQYVHPHNDMNELQKEGVGDKYFEKLTGRPDEFSKFTTTYAKEENKEDVVFEDDGWIIIKNPKSWENIMAWVRGVIDKNGNLYVEQQPVEIHEEMLGILEDLGVLRIVENWDSKIPTEFVTVQRYRMEDAMLVGESNAPMIDDEKRPIKDYNKEYWDKVASKKDAEPVYQQFLDKAQSKNPQIRFINQHIRDYNDNKQLDKGAYPNTFNPLNEADIMSLQELPFKQEIEQLGGKIFSVGGAVRDEFLGKQSKDLDVLITGVPLEQLEQLLTKYGRVDAVGKSFGVLKFKPKGATEDIDIAIPRTETATGEGGHQGFDVKSDHALPIEKDLERRDFTINAIAKDTEGNIVDPYNGREDLQNKIIRVVNPEAFSDDPLRMLRAVQFASRFGFTIEPETMQMIKDNAGRVKEIAPERILTEFDKIIKKGNIRIGVGLLVNSGLFSQIFGGQLKPSMIGRRDFEGIQTMGEFIFLMTNSVIPNPADFYKANLRGDIPTYKEIKALELAFDSGEATNILEARSVAHNMYVISPQSLESQILPPVIKTAADELLQGKYPKTVNELAVKGNDLVGLGLKGKEVGDMQKSLLIKIYADKVRNSKEELLSLAGQNKSVEEGVADTYGEREFGIPNDYRVRDAEAGSYVQRELEKPIGTARESEYHEGAKTSDIYKNPKSLQNFDKDVRAISDAEGNLYVMQKDIDVMHGSMGKAIGFKNYVYDYKDKYALLHRVGTTNSFGLGDTGASHMYSNPEAVLNLLRKAKAKNRKYDFYTEYFQDVEPGMKKVGLANEGVADKYFEKLTGRADVTSVEDTKAASYVQREKEKPFGFIKGQRYDKSSYVTPVYLNPKSLSNFGEDARAIGASNGNLYVALENDWFNHGEMALMIGLTGDDYAVYDNDKFVLLHRMGKTNKFGLADSSDQYMNDGFGSRDEVVDILREVKRRNPQYMFYLNYYQRDTNDVYDDDEMTEIGDYLFESYEKTLDSITEALESITEALEYPEIVPNKYLVNGEMVGLKFFIKKYDEWNNQGGKPGYSDPSKASVLEFFQNNYEDFSVNKKLLQDLLWALTDRELLNESNMIKVYHGGSVNDKESAENNLYVTADEKQARAYARDNDGNVVSFMVDKDKLADEQQVRDLIVKLGMKSKSSEWYNHEMELNLYELIDGRNFYSALNDDDIDKLFNILKAKGYEGIEFTDMNILSLHNDIENIIIFDPQKTLNESNE